jgi:signal transduction histidine kinase
MLRALAARARGASSEGGLMIDLALGTVLAAVLVVITDHLPFGDHRPIDALAFVLVVIAGASLAFWRRVPLVVFGVVIVAVGVYVGRNYPNGPILATGLLALLSLSSQTDRRTATVGGAALCLVLGIAGTVAGGGAAVLAFFFLGWSAAVVLLGDALRNRQRYLQELKDRARDVEHTREEVARRRVAEDRLRIARDLHDGVAHAMATINVQAGAAAHVIDRRPQVAKDALVAIRRASGDVLDELAAMLRLLRETDEDADRTPLPGLDQIAPLVEATRCDKLQVPLVLEGPTGDVPRSIGTAAYRIVQESLTNVLRHADATTAQVMIRADGKRGLTVEVCDDGSGAPHASSGTGIGIRGMRERAESTGGRFEAGRARQGGFAVRVVWDGGQ